MNWKTLVVTSAALVGAGVAHAALPPGVVDYEIDFGPLFYSSAPTFGSVNTVLGSHSYYASGFPNPTVSATTHSDSGITYADTGVGYEYYAEIVGPANVQVPLILAYGGSASISGSPFVNGYPGSAQAVIEGPLGVGGVFALQTVGFESYSGLLSGYRYTNSVFPILIGVEAFAYNNNGDTSTRDVSITLDPLLYINPSFAAFDPNYLNDYSIVFSTEVGNSAGVPEPGAWATMLLGLGSLGSVMRSRRRYRGISQISAADQDVGSAELSAADRTLEMSGWGATGPRVLGQGTRPLRS